MNIKKQPSSATQLIRLLQVTGVLMVGLIVVYLVIIALFFDTDSNPYANATIVRIGDQSAETSSQLSVEKVMLISIQNYTDIDFNMYHKLWVKDGQNAWQYPLPGNQIKAGQTVTYCFFPQALEGKVDCPSNTVPFAILQAAHEVLVFRMLGMQMMESQVFQVSEIRSTADFPIVGLNVSVQLK